MKRTMHIRPAPGRLVRDPKTKDYLPADGAVVQASPYWIRRVADGDVVTVPAAKPLPPQKNTPSKAGEP